MYLVKSMVTGCHSADKHCIVTPSLHVGTCPIAVVVRLSGEMLISLEKEVGESPSGAFQVTENMKFTCSLKCTFVPEACNSFSPVHAVIYAHTCIHVLDVHLVTISCASTVETCG